MKVSQNGINLIKKFEGCELKPYLCPAGVLTIGYGHTKGVKKGTTITYEQAEQYLKEDIAPCERVLNAMNVNFRQNQFDALISWLFNLGAGNFNSSTLKKYIVANKSDEEITDQIIRWNKSGGKPLNGLSRRRVAEANMFLGRELYYFDEKTHTIQKKQ